MSLASHVCRGRFRVVNRDDRGRFARPGAPTPPADAAAPVLSYRETAGPVADTVWTRDDRNARRRAKTAVRFTENHQAATARWWGRLPEEDDMDDTFTADHARQRAAIHRPLHILTDAELRDERDVYTFARNVLRDLRVPVQPFVDPYYSARVLGARDEIKRRRRIDAEAEQARRRLAAIGARVAPMS